MSNWMTPGSARLKPKQNSSFSRQARQRAAIITPENVMLQEMAPSKSLPRTRPRRNEGTVLFAITFLCAVVRVGLYTNRPSSMFLQSAGTC